MEGESAKQEDLETDNSPIHEPARPAIDINYTCIYLIHCHWSHPRTSTTVKRHTARRFHRQHEIESNNDNFPPSSSSYGSWAVRSRDIPRAETTGYVDSTAMQVLLPHASTVRSEMNQNRRVPLYCRGQ